MAKRLYRSSDVPDFDTYPLTPHPTKVTGGLEPGLEANRSPLERRAAALGAAAGKLVRMVRRRSGDMPQPSIAVFVGEVADYAKYRVGRVRDGATARLQEIERLAKENAVFVLRETRIGLVRTRRKAQSVVNDYPVQVALGAGVVGLLIGIGLRVRRTNRA